MINLIKRNFWYKLLSLAVAILLHSYADTQLNPRTSGLVSVEPKPANLPAELVIRKMPEGVMVTVSGPQANVDRFKLRDDKAVVDLTGAKPGRFRAPVRYSTDSAAVEIAGPNTLDVMLEKKVNRPWFIDFEYDITPPAGYTFNDPKLDPPKVNVAGLADDVNRIARVVAILDNTQGSGASVRSVTLAAQDKDLRMIEGLEIVPPKVKVTLTLKKLLSVKSLLLSAQINGSPAPGYSVVSYQFIPSIVSVTGVQDVLSSLSSLEVPVNIDGIRGTENRIVRLRPPSGVNLQNSAQVQLRIVVQSVARPFSTPLPLPTPASTPSTVPVPKPTINSTNPVPRETP